VAISSFYSVIRNFYVVLWIVNALPLAPVKGGLPVTPVSWHEAGVHGILRVRRFVVEIKIP
jgi:hypothetical protein